MINTLDMNFDIGYSCIAALLILIGKWLILEKMGEKGWKAIIPIYSDYLIFKHVWTKKAFAEDVLTGVIGGIASGCGTGIAKATTLHPAISMIFIIIGLTFVIAHLVIQLMCCYKLAKAFGHGKGYTFGLIFFQPIFMLMLGLGKNECYAG